MPSCSLLPLHHGFLMINAISQTSAVQRKSFCFSALSSLALVGHLIQQTHHFSHKRSFLLLLYLRNILNEIIAKHFGKKTPVSLGCVQNTGMEKHTKRSRDKTSHNLPVCLILYIGTSHSARYFPLILQQSYKFFCI